MPTELLKNTQEQEKAPNSKIEALKAGELYTLDSDAPALEVRQSPSGELSRLASFELGTGKAGEEGPLHPDDPRVAIVDVWKNEQGDFLISPRSLATTEEINEKAWRIADQPKHQLPLGRSRNDLWERVTGSPLPEQVSAQHFGIVLGEDGKLNFVDVGSTNGTRMETALTPEPSITDALSAEKRAFEPMTGSLEPESESKALDTENIPIAEASMLVEPATIHERLGTEPGDIESTPEPEKKLAENEELSQTLRAMKAGIDDWVMMLGDGRPITRSSDLYEVSAGLLRHMAWLGELGQKEDIDPALRSRINDLDIDARRINASAIELASGVDAVRYRGADAHLARHEVKRQLERYDDSVASILQVLAHQSQTIR